MLKWKKWVTKGCLYEMSKIGGFIETKQVSSCQGCREEDWGEIANEWWMCPKGDVVMIAQLGKQTKTHRTGTL